MGNTVQPNNGTGTAPNPNKTNGDNGSLDTTTATADAKNAQAQSQKFQMDMYKLGLEDKTFTALLTKLNGSASKIERNVKA